MSDFRADTPKPLLEVTRTSPPAWTDPADLLIKRWAKATVDRMVAKMPKLVIDDSEVTSGFCSMPITVHSDDTDWTFYCTRPAGHAEDKCAALGSDGVDKVMWPEPKRPSPRPRRTTKAPAGGAA